MAFRRVLRLTGKTLRIALLRRPLSTTFRAFILPVAFMIFLAEAKNFFVPSSKFGFGSPAPLRSLHNALDAAKGGRYKVVLSNSGFANGAIDGVLNQLETQITAAGKVVERTASANSSASFCPTSLRGTSLCIASVIFHSSPSEGSARLWNYTLRADGGLATEIYVDREDNAAQIYVLPLQRAIDQAILGNTTLPFVQEFPYTAQSDAQRESQIRELYMGAIVNVLGAAFFLAICGVVYQEVGFMAHEREIGMAQLIDTMLPIRQWESQAARLLSHHFAFSIIYFPSWLIIGLIQAYAVFTLSSAATIVLYNLLFGVAFASYAILGASFFRKAQLSGITVIIISLALAIVAQFIQGRASTGAVAILSLLFPSANYVFYIVMCARVQRNGGGIDLLSAVPGLSRLPPVALWIFLVVQLIGFMLLGAVVERWLYGTASKNRSLDGADETYSIKLSNFTKRYEPSWLSKLRCWSVRRPATTAANAISLNAVRGEILVLLGANGSGKTTTLEAICGFNKPTSGELHVDDTGGIGICPQRNVLWDDLTVEEHVKLWVRLSRSGKDVSQLIASCDLVAKRKAKAKTLSGGQKRKLQLAMMLSGNAQVCCIDEVSSGLDPLSRKKIWDILLTERGSRTVIFTTHFLDEADFLADNIAILSKGHLKIQGPAAQLKADLGEGYRVRLPRSEKLPELSVRPAIDSGQATYELPEDQVAPTLEALEKSGFNDYQVSGPSIEDVFLKLAAETQVEEGEAVEPELSLTQSLEQEPPRRPGKLKLIWILFRKRFIVLRRNYVPHSFALLIPILTAGLTTMLLRNFGGAGCGPIDSNRRQRRISWANFASPIPLVGFAPGISRPANLLQVIGLRSSYTPTSFENLTSYSEFNKVLSNLYPLIRPGAAFFDTNGTTIAYAADQGISTAVLTQNAVNNIAGNVNISVGYQNLAVPWNPSYGNTLQVTIYFVLAMCAYPAFFSLYPTVERMNKIRALQYNNGVTPLSLWTSHLLFDSIWVIAVSVVSAVLFAVLWANWYHVGYLFAVFIFYGITSTLYSYALSLFCKSQLASYAFAAGSQAVLFFISLIGYLVTTTYAQPNVLDRTLLIVHFTIGLITPSGNLFRAMMVSFNLFNISCRGSELDPSPSRITKYGGPILYLICQSVVLLLFLVWHDGGLRLSWKAKTRDEEVSPDDMSDNSKHALRAVNVVKKYGKQTVVDNVSFGVSKGELFALLGPNGAGKSTTVSMIEGTVKIDSGEIWVTDVPVARNKSNARAHLGVCPQFDAIDLLTTREHLRFYARVKGVRNIDHSVKHITEAVGLQRFLETLGRDLSGGNKRKLSLAIALLGNPPVVLLDEPSSGMDAAAKRIMWRTLAAVSQARSVLLTTHSMEEANALATRVGIMAQRMLALGTTDELRRQSGNRYYVHLVLGTAPHSSTEELGRLREWVANRIPEADIEERTFRGQLRFSVPTAVVDDTPDIQPVADSSPKPASGIRSLFLLLQHNMHGLGVTYYTIGETSLNEVFLKVVGDNFDQEAAEDGGKSRFASMFRLRRRKERPASSIT